MIVAHLRVHRADKLEVSLIAALNVTGQVLCGGLRSSSVTKPSNKHHRGVTQMMKTFCNSLQEASPRQNVICKPLLMDC